MYINKLKNSTIADGVSIVGYNPLKIKYNRKFCIITFKKHKFKVEVYAYNYDYKWGLCIDEIIEEINITEQIAKDLLDKYEH